MNEKDKYFEMILYLNNFKGKNGIDAVEKIKEILSEYNIEPQSVLIQDTEAYKHQNFTLSNMCKLFGLPKDKILDARKINWYMISRHSKMSEGFMNFATEQLNWNWICYRIKNGDLKVTEKFKKEHEYEFEEFDYQYDEDEKLYDEDELRSYDRSGSMDAIKKVEETKDKQKPNKLVDGPPGGIFPLRGKPLNMNNPFSPFTLPPNIIESMPSFFDTLPPSFESQGIIKLPDGIDIENMGEYEKQKMIEYISKQYNIPPEQIVINTYDDKNGLKNNITGNPNYPKDVNKEEKKPLDEEYITLENYRKLLIDFDEYDFNMWSYISRKLWLSPEFVDKFSEKVSFSGLVNENPHFPEMMNCDWFFDKYIEVCKQLKVVQESMTEHLKPEYVNITQFNINVPRNEM